MVPVPVRRRAPVLIQAGSGRQRATALRRRWATPQHGSSARMLRCAPEPSRSLYHRQLPGASAEGRPGAECPSDTADISGYSNAFEHKRWVTHLTADEAYESQRDQAIVTRGLSERQETEARCQRSVPVRDIGVHIGWMASDTIRGAIKPSLTGALQKVRLRRDNMRSAVV